MRNFFLTIVLLFTTQLAYSGNCTDPFSNESGCVNNSTTISANMIVVCRNGDRVSADGTVNKLNGDTENQSPLSEHGGNYHLACATRGGFLSYSDSSNAANNIKVSSDYVIPAATPASGASVVTPSSGNIIPYSTSTSATSTTTTSTTGAPCSSACDCSDNQSCLAGTCQAALDILGNLKKSSDAGGPILQVYSAGGSTSSTSSSTTGGTGSCRRTCSEGGGSSTYMGVTQAWCCDTHCAGCNAFGCQFNGSDIKSTCSYAAPTAGWNDYSTCPGHSTSTTSTSTTSSTTTSSTTGVSTTGGSCTNECDCAGTYEACIAGSCVNIDSGGGSCSSPNTLVKGDAMCRFLCDGSGMFSCPVSPGACGSTSTTGPKISTSTSGSTTGCAECCVDDGAKVVSPATCCNGYSGGDWACGTHPNNSIESGSYCASAPPGAEPGQCAPK